MLVFDDVTGALLFILAAATPGVADVGSAFSFLLLFATLAAVVLSDCSPRGGRASLSTDGRGRTPGRIALRHARMCLIRICIKDIHIAQDSMTDWRDRDDSYIPR